MAQVAVEREVSLLVAKLVSNVAEDIGCVAFTTTADLRGTADSKRDANEELKRKKPSGRRRDHEERHSRGPNSALDMNGHMASSALLPTGAVSRLDPVRVGYVFSPELIAQANRLPKVRGRAVLVHELIKSYGLLQNVQIINSIKATEIQLRTFHTEDYIEYMKKLDSTSRQSLVNSSSAQTDLEASFYDLDTSACCEDFGLNYDCQPLPELVSLVQNIAGGTLSAAEAIANEEVDIAINWTGGWHHGHKDEASGYCYVNDIVLGILHLLSRGFERVLYVDYDLHHGDGVEAAFAHSNKVMTISFHKYEIGFFPGTGAVKDTGFGQRGKGYAVNVPFKDGLNDQMFKEVARTVIDNVCQSFEPEVIVAQFGADTLAGDPMSSFNLTQDGPVECLRDLMKLNLPLLVLGGGGYHLTNTARLWTRLTAEVLQEKLSNDIPDHSCFLEYKPSYELDIEAGLRKNLNSKEEVKEVVDRVVANLKHVGGQ